MGIYPKKYAMSAALFDSKLPFSHAYENGLSAVIDFLVFTCTSHSEFDRPDDCTSVDANCN